MGAKFQIAVRKSNGDLHVRTRGDFDGSSAWQLINLLNEKYDGKGKVYIDTRDLRQVCPFGCSTFQCRLNQCKVPARMLHFEGARSQELAPAGSKIRVSREKAPCQCNGQCKTCLCSGKDGNPGKYVRIQEA